MANEVLARLDNVTGRLDPGGAPVHDDLDGLTGHTPSAVGQPVDRIPRTSGDGTWELVPTPAADPWTAEGAILGASKVAPATATNYTAGNSAPADYNAPTLSVTFTTPDSGKVLVTLDAAHTLSTAGSVSWMLRQSGAIIPGTVVNIDGDTTTRRRTVSVLVEGLTPGQSVTWTWAGQTHSSGVVSTLKAGPGTTVGTTNVGPALIVVRDAPF